MKNDDLRNAVNSALNRTDIITENDEDQSTTHFVLPANGVELSSPAAMASLLLNGDAAQLDSVLDPKDLGLKADDAQVHGLFLTALSYKTDRTEVSMDVAWHTQPWTIIPGILTVSTPAATVSVSNDADRGLSIGATITGHAVFFDTVSLDLFATRIWAEQGSQSLTLMAQMPDETELSLDQMLGAVGLSGLPGAASIAINDLAVMASPSDKSVNVGFSLAHPWRPGWGEGVFELTDASVSLAISPVLTAAQIRATTTLFNQSVSVTVDHQADDWGFGFSTDLAGKTLGDIIDEFGGQFGLGHISDLMGPFGDIGIDTFEAYAFWGSHDVSASMTSSTQWSPHWCGDGLSIGDLHFDVSHTGGKDGQTRAAIGGVMMFGTHAMDVAASYEGHDEGLDFSGAMTNLDTADLTLADVDFPGGFHLSKDTFPVEPSDLRLTKFEVSFNTHSKAVKLAFGGHLDAGMGMDFAFDIALTPQAGGDGTYDRHFGGTVTLGGHQSPEPIDITPTDGAMVKRSAAPTNDVHPKPGDPGMTFDLVFDGAQTVDEQGNVETSKTFVATYRNPAGKMTSLKPVLGALMTSVDALKSDEEPPDVRFVIRQAVLLASKPDKEKPFGFMLSMSIDAGADLSKLPLVSSVVPADKPIGLGFKPSYATRQFETAELGTLNGLLPDGVEHFNAVMPRERGFDMATLVMIGDFEIVLQQPMKMIAALVPPENDEDQAFEVVPKPNQAPKGPVKWIKVQKSIGPLHISQLGIGLDMKKMQAKAVVDASIGGGGMVLGAMGLGAVYDFKTKDLSATLDGLALTYSKGTTNITGAFLRLDENDYVGAAMLRTSKFGLSALGGYSDTDDMKSMFVYGLLDYPLGGPPSCFVEGVAAGFGYNRKIRDIQGNEVRDFPFVKEAISPSNKAPVPPKKPADAQDALIAEMRGLESWVQPHAGEHFLAVGLKFNTYKIIDSFALAMVSFGESFKVSILGTSTLVLPPAPPGVTDKEKDKEPKLAVIDMSIKGTFDPQESKLGIDALLNDTSWVLSKAINLKGWFALYSWYDGEHGGDFVTTIGGFHPRFKPPKHYPRVSRVTVGWHVSDNVEIKGTTYYALTPNAMMAGGQLKATWRSGPLHASFTIGADFLMQWKPFHYEGTVHAEISAGVGGLTGSIGATLDLFGPEFSGTAKIHFLMVSYKLDFGGDKPAPKPIPWSEFRSSFLPERDSAIVTSTPTGGVLRTVPASEADNRPQTFIVSPKDLRIETASMIPASTLGWDHLAEQTALAPRVDGLTTTFGVAPMDKKTGVSGTQTVRIRYDCMDKPDTGSDGIEHCFRMTARPLPFAGAMWGTKGKEPDVAGATVADILGGCQLEALKPVVSGQTTSIPRRNVKFEPRLVWEDPQTKAPAMRTPKHLNVVQDKAEIASRLSSKAAHDTRKSMAKFLNIELPKGVPSVTPALCDALTFAPRSTALAETVT